MKYKTVPIIKGEVAMKIVLYFSLEKYKSVNGTTAIKVMIPSLDNIAKIKHRPDKIKFFMLLVLS